MVNASRGRGNLRRYINSPIFAAAGLGGAPWG